MKYISCFSGIGGLEASTPPELFCEQDKATWPVLQGMHPDAKVPIFDDVCNLNPPEVDVVAGGWPCQDVSIAGLQQGLSGLRSGLLRELLRVAVESRAHTIVAENVSNLLRMRGGAEFEASLREFTENGFQIVGWRLLNAREFGLPQQRSRLLIIASKHLELVETLFRKVIPTRPVRVPVDPSDPAAGFYWTAGIHSINYTRGYVPTIKIGSSVGIASPPAVHYGNVVRVLSADEALKLQGFNLTAADFQSRTAAYKAAGNAVARDIGRWVLDGVAAGRGPKAERLPEQLALDVGPAGANFPGAGIFVDGSIEEVKVTSGPAASNLSEFLNLDAAERLSPRAAAGLLRRLDRSNQPCPSTLREALAEIGGRVPA